MTPTDLTSTTGDTEMTTLTKSQYAKIRRHIAAAGYSSEAISKGLAFARAEEITDTREAYIAAVTVILHSAKDYRDGVRFSVENGYGPE